MSTEAGASGPHAARNRPTIVYYAHHHGSGHRLHAARFARICAERGIADVVVCGTRVDGLNGVRTVTLPPDDRIPAGGSPHVEPADSPFHFTPRTPAVRERMRTFSQLLSETGPALVVVDVSVEIATFAALAGYRVISRRMPGDRSDRAHRIGYDVSERLFAYYPREVESDSFADAHAGKTTWLGMPEPSRAVGDETTAPDGLARALPFPDALDQRSVVVLVGTGGDGLPLDELIRAAAATPDREWFACGDVDASGSRIPSNLHLLGRVPNPEPLLRGAGVIVAGAGHNTVADIAAARRPAVIIPEERPFGEQRHFADAIARVAGVPVANSWESVRDWDALLQQASAIPASALADALLVSEETFGDRLEAMLGGLL